MHTTVIGRVISLVTVAHHSYPLSRRLAAVCTARAHVNSRTTSQTRVHHIRFGQQCRERSTTHSGGGVPRDHHRQWQQQFDSASNASQELTALLTSFSNHQQHPQHHRHRITVAQARTLLGKLSFAATVLPTARPFMRALIDLTVHKHRMPPLVSLR